MKTDDLIRALAADGDSATSSIGRLVGIRLLPAVGVAIGIYFAVLGVRPHLLTAIDSDPRVAFKIGLMVVLLCLSVPVTLRLAKPAAGPGAAAVALISVPALLLLAVAYECFAFPEADWWHRWMGHNAALCLLSIPLLSLAPLCALLLALRYGAPSRPALSGAAAGLLAGAIGTTLYATHCPDDSPLFVATWYSIGIAIVAGAGTVIGACVLRW
jgi:hypothetical protein